MHAMEKILARAAGLGDVTAGDIVNCQIDIAGINDLYLQTIRSFEEMGGVAVSNPDHVVVFLDHYAPASTVKQAQNQKAFRAFCQAQNIQKLMDINRGVCHQVMADEGLSKPGALIVITDSHTTMHGAFGAFGTGVGATDMAIILRTGKLWFRVPPIIRMNLSGSLSSGVYAKDVILHIIGELKANYAVYCGIEFTGSLLATLSVSERMVLCGMGTELGAKAAYIQPDETTASFFQENGISEWPGYFTDPDYSYADSLEFNLSELGPQLAIPSSVDNVHPVSSFLGTGVDQCFLGTCTGGRLEDIAIAAKILKGKSVNPGTRLLVVPASRQVLRDSINNGYMDTLVEAGATFVSPGCAACLGTHEGILADGEVCISTSSRNFPGRMGSNKAEIFLASPASVAAAAIEGRIVDPRHYID